jgi:hypothetical protein
MKNIPPMKLFLPEGYSEPKLSKEEFVKEGLSEIVGNRVAQGIRTSKKDLNRFRKSLENDWELKNS